MDRPKISRAPGPAGRGAASVYRLRVTLCEGEPAVWRRVAAHSSTTLRDLHRIIQAVMPWGDIHLHHFAAHGFFFFGVPEEEDVKDVVHDEREVTLGALLRRRKDTLLYTYDFADEWRHTIVLEDILPDEAPIPRPRCIDGGGACPPEESGSLLGYREKIEIAGNPAHPQHGEVRGWLDRHADGGHWDPAVFDCSAANARLAAICT